MSARRAPTAAYLWSASNTINTWYEPASSGNGVNTTEHVICAAMSNHVEHNAAFWISWSYLHIWRNRHLQKLYSYWENVYSQQLCLQSKISIYGYPLLQRGSLYAPQDIDDLIRFLVVRQTWSFVYLLKKWYWKHADNVTIQEYQTNISLSKQRLSERCVRVTHNACSNRYSLDKRAHNYANYFSENIVATKRRSMLRMINKLWL